MPRYVLAGFSEQSELDRGRFRTTEGHSLRIAHCGVEYHPAQPEAKGDYHSFSSEQDKLLDNLVGLDVISGMDGSRTVRHYLTIGGLEVMVPLFR